MAADPSMEPPKAPQLWALWKSAFKEHWVRHTFEAAIVGPSATVLLWRAYGWDAGIQNALTLAPVAVLLFSVPTWKVMKAIWEYEDRLGVWHSPVAKAERHRHVIERDRAELAELEGAIEEVELTISRLGEWSVGLLPILMRGVALPPRQFPPHLLPRIPERLVPIVGSADNSRSDPVPGEPPETAFPARYPGSIPPSRVPEGARAYLENQGRIQQSIQSNLYRRLWHWAHDARPKLDQHGRDLLEKIEKLKERMAG